MISDYKITDGDTNGKKISELDDRPSMSAKDLKAKFDAYSELIKQRFNDFVISLDTGGANAVVTKAWFDENLPELGGGDMMKANYVEDGGTGVVLAAQSATNATNSTKLNNKALTDIGYIAISKNITLGTSWSSGYQAVSISGLLASDDVEIAPNYSFSGTSYPKSTMEAYNMISYAVPAVNSLKFYCFDKVPTVSIPLTIKVRRYT